MGRVGSWGAAAAAALAVAGCGDAREARTPLAATSGCASCHSAPDEAPPFRDQNGSTDASRLPVGAHDAHLHARLAAPRSCADCHAVPQRLNDPGHLETPPGGDVRFGALARTGGASPVYVDQGCQASYCHGNFPGGNRTNAPRWVAGARAAECGTCHGVPPPTGRHPEHTAAAIRCDQCHGPFAQATHVNGAVEVSLPVYDPGFATCAQACHAPRAWRAPGDATR